MQEEHFAIQQRKRPEDVVSWDDYKRMVYTRAVGTCPLDSSIRMLRNPSIIDSKAKINSVEMSRLWLAKLIMSKNKLIQICYESMSHSPNVTKMVGKYFECCCIVCR